MSTKVAPISPMRRGLKLNDYGTVEIVTARVAPISPMRRGLKPKVAVGPKAKAAAELHRSPR